MSQHNEISNMFFNLRTRKSKTLMSKCVDVLKKWTGKTEGRVIFDSVVDEFTTEQFVEKVKNKTNVAVICWTEDGGVFGGFYSDAVTNPNNRNKSCSWIFAFSFVSHGCYTTPQRFLVKEGLKSKVSVRFGHNDILGWFIGFGVDDYGCFGFGNERSKTCCFGISTVFDGIEGTTFLGETEKEQGKKGIRLMAVKLGKTNEN